MSTLIQKQISSAGVPLNVSLLPKQKSLMYSATPGNHDAFDVYLSADGVNYDRVVKVNGPGIYSIDAAAQWMKSTFTPTASAGGIVPVLYCNGTFEDSVTSVVATEIITPVNVTGGNGPTTTTGTGLLTKLVAGPTGVSGPGPTALTIAGPTGTGAGIVDAGIIWNFQFALGALTGNHNPVPAGWVSGQAYAANSVIQVGANFWITIAGLTAGGSIPAALQDAQTLGTPVPESGGNWSPVGQWKPGTSFVIFSGTAADNTYVYNAGNVYALTATTGTSATGFFDGSVMWTEVAGLIAPVAWPTGGVVALNKTIAVAVPGGGTNYWITTTAGTTAGTIPAGLSATGLGAGASVVDNTAVWTYVALWTAGVGVSAPNGYMYTGPAFTSANVYRAIITGVTSGTIPDGTTAWTFEGLLKTPTPSTWVATTGYAPGTIIAVPNVISGGTNYWITPLGGTTAGGSIPAALQDAQTLGQAVGDYAHVYWIAVVKWTPNTGYTAGSIAPPAVPTLQYVFNGPNVYLVTVPGFSADGTPDGTTAWSFVESLNYSGLTGGLPSAWPALTAVTLNQVIQTGVSGPPANPPVINTWICTTAGTTAATIPAGLLTPPVAPATSVPQSTTVTDGTVVWTSVTPWSVGATFTLLTAYTLSNGNIYQSMATGITAGMVADGTTLWTYLELFGTPTVWPMSVAVAVGKIIAVGASGGGTNYWLCTIPGTTAGSIPGGLSAAGVLQSTTVTDGGATWTSLLPWALSTVFTIGTGYCFNDGFVYTCSKTGHTVNNPNGPGAYVDTFDTTEFPTGWPDNFTAVYSFGQSADNIVLMGSPDGKNWTNLRGPDGELDGIVTEFSGSRQTRYVVGAYRFIGGWTQNLPSGNLSICASENVIPGTAPAGPAAPAPARPYGYFFALMPGDNSATVASNTGVQFPQNGPAGGGVVRASASQFILPNVGTYEIYWQVSVTEPGQLMLDLDSGAGPALIASSVVGRATGTSQLSNKVLLTTSVTGSVLRVINPPGNSTALTITPVAGGTHSVSATLVIQQIA